MPGYCHDYLKFYQFPNSNLFTHRLLFFSREATSETYAPGLLSHIFALRSTFSLRLFLDLLNQKIQKYLAAIYSYLFYLAFDLSIYYNLSTSVLSISGTVTRKGLTTPLTHWVAMFCYLCAGALYIVLLGSPTGSITLVSYLREIPTAVVLHHPSLSREIPT